MAVTPGSTILTAEFNSLQNRIAKVLGTGVGDFGYGQTVTSAQVSNGASVTSARLRRVRDDIETAYIHQTGNTVALAEISTGDIIGAEQSGTDLTFDSNGDYTFVNPAPSKGFLDYLSIMSTVESNRFAVSATEQEFTPLVASDQRTGQWSYVTVDSEVEVRFGSANARRHFFNTGGSIEISGVVTALASGTESYQRNLGWQQIIENPGAVRMDRNSVSISNPGASGVTYPQGTNFGNNQLTSSYAEIFRKQASGSVYTNSYWSVEGRLAGPGTIKFRVRLVDAGPESDPDGIVPGSVYGGVKEPVTADVNMRYGTRRAAGAVVIPQPSFVVTNSFQ